MGQGSLNRWKDVEVRGHLTYLANRCCLSPTDKAVFLRAECDFEDISATYQFGNEGVRYVKHPHIHPHLYSAKMRQFEQDAYSAQLGQLPRSKVRRCLPLLQDSLYERRHSFHHPTRGLVAVHQQNHVSIYLKLSRSVEDEVIFFPSRYRNREENFTLFSAPLGLKMPRPYAHSPESGASSDDEEDNSFEAASVKDEIYRPQASQ